MKNKTFALQVLSLVTVAMLASCGGQGKEDNLPFNFAPDFSYVTEEAVTGKTLNVGAVLIGDETEGYSEAHINGIEKAKKVLEEKGATVNVSYEKKVADDQTATVKAKVESLVSNGNNVVIVNSYGHQNAFGEGQFDVSTAKAVDFLSMTGDTACVAKKDNYHNAFNATYQSRYASGYVAGLKIKELIEDNKLTSANKDANGNIKVGYVGAFPYAEVVSGYTAFYLGIKSVVSNVVMSVKYVSSWWQHDWEKNAAKSLISEGCVVLSQHADSTGTPEACEEAFQEGKYVYNVGYNVSMIEAAPRSSLTSATNDWSVFYTRALFNKITGTAIPRDWCAGYESGAVALTKINYDCFKDSKANIDAKVCEVTKALHDGSLKVFDCSKWTVGGENLTSYTITDKYSTVIGTQCIKQSGSTYYFDESNTGVRSAPYFDARIDGITELK